MTEIFNDLYLHEQELLASAEQQMIQLLAELAMGTDTPELQDAVPNSTRRCFNWYSRQGAKQEIRSVRV